MQNQNSKFNFSLTPDISDPETTSITEFESILSPTVTQPDTSIQDFDYNENLLQPHSFSISDSISDAELFYPAQYYQDWVERTNTPASLLSTSVTLPPTVTPQTKLISRNSRIIIRSSPTTCPQHQYRQQRLQPQPRPRQIHHRLQPLNRSIKT